METTDIQNKNIKTRLDELRELFDGGYITEGEFKTARVNILDEGGIDVVTQVQHAHRPYFQDEEEEEEEYEAEVRRGGCGCFLLTLILAAFFVSGLAFFAAPYWPEEWGGARARAAREWFIAKGAELTGGTPGGPADEALPDPAASDDVTELEQTDGTDGAEGTEISVTAPGLPDLPDELSGDGSFISVDLNATPRPLAVPNPIPPALAVAEMQLPAEPEAEEPAAVPPAVIEPEAIEPEIIISQAPALPSEPLPENAVYGTVTAQSARIRSGPDTSTNDNVVGWGRSGDRFIVMEEGTGRDGSRWYRVEYEDGSKRGWISGSLVRLER